MKKGSRAPVLPRVPPRSKRGGFADSLARDVIKSGCGGRIRTGDARRMKPLPYHLATPLLLKKIWHGSSVLPRTRKDLETSLRKLTPAVFLMIWKMVRPAGLAPAFPDWKSGILLLDDDRMINL